MSLIMIDAGHGGQDPGAVGPRGTKEKDITLKLAKLVGDFLTQAGIKVEYTRFTDVYISLTERAIMANKARADYFVSIHINSAESITASGTETFALAPGGEGEKLAKAINDSLVNHINLPNRGVKFAKFDVLKLTNMSAALTEVCFISNHADEERLKDEGFLNKAALGIAKGIVSFLGINWQDDAIKSDKSDIPQWQRDGFNKLIEKKLISSPEYWEPRLNENITVGEIFGILGRL